MAITVTKQMANYKNIGKQFELFIVKLFQIN